MDNKKVLLVHGFQKMDLAKLEVLGHKLIIVDNENGGAKLHEILEGKSTKVKNNLQDEKVIIFNGYGDEELQETVASFRNLFEERPIMAVVTENSINWAFEYLLVEHLIKDRDFNRENHKKYIEQLEKENKAFEESKKNKGE